MPRLIAETREAVASGKISPSDLDDVMRSLRNVANLAGDQIKELPGIIQSGIDQLQELIKTVAPEAAKIGARGAEAARKAIQSLGIGGVSIPEPSNIDFGEISNRAKKAIKAADELLKKATKGLGKLIESIFG